MFATLNQTKKRIHNLLRLRRKDFRRKMERTLSQYAAGSTKSVDEVLTDLRYLVRNRKLRNIRKELPYYLESGMHLKGADVTDYFSFLEWKKTVLAICGDAEPGKAILDNKQATSAFLRERGIRAPLPLGTLYPGQAATTLPPLLAEHGLIFCKPLSLLGGKGCMKLGKADSDDGCYVNGSFMAWDEVENKLQLPKEYSHHPAIFMLEECVQQHPTIAALHPSSINTLRLSTLRHDDGSVTYLQGIIRIGSGGSSVDNISQGGFFVGINANGTLMEEGLSDLPSAPIPLLQHPDTGVRFKDMQLPFWEEAKELVCSAHKLFSPRIPVLMWDVAITPTGPLMIEGNLDGGIEPMQRAHGGWLPIYRDYLLPALNRQKAQR